MAKFNAGVSGIHMPNRLRTHRDFAKAAITGLPIAGLFGAKLNSTVSGLKLGAISYCFRSLPRTPDTDSIDTLIKACRECGVANVELTSPMVEAEYKRRNAAGKFKLLFEEELEDQFT